MQLQSFRIRNYRSIDDSGNIEVSRLTALLGRNESGKSNLLRGLHSLNPAEGFAALNRNKDFPRHRDLNDCSNYTVVVESVWEFDAAEKAELAAIWPEAAEKPEVTIGRYYTNTRFFRFSVDRPAFSSTKINSLTKKIVSNINSRFLRTDNDTKDLVTATLATFVKAITPTAISSRWPSLATPALASVRELFSSQSIEISSPLDQLIVELEQLAASLTDHAIFSAKARAWTVTCSQ